MTLLVDNRLTGEADDPVSNATLAATGEAGTVTIATPGTRAVYDGTHTVHGLPVVRLDSGHHRLDTPRLQFGLPVAPWAVRFYVYHPGTQEAGHGASEVRWLLRLDDTGVISHETQFGNAAARLAPPPDLSVSPVAATAGGTAHQVGQLLRVEVRCDGTDTELRYYPGHQDHTPRTYLWAGTALSGPADLTAYRYRIRATLQFGDQGAAVAELQNELLDLGYDLGVWGADGDYGNATMAAVEEFQTDYGLTPVDGVAGPETRAAIDLALERAVPPVYLSHLAVSDGAWIGPAQAPPAPDPIRLRVGFLPI